MEGTNMGGGKSCVTESDLETEFEALFRQTKGVFVMVGRTLTAPSRSTGLVSKPAEYSLSISTRPR